MSRYPGCPAHRQRGDIIKLNFGDKLRLGRTEVYLEETDDEATQIV